MRALQNFCRILFYNGSVSLEHLADHRVYIMGYDISTTLRFSVNPRVHSSLSHRYASLTTRVYRFIDVLGSPLVAMGGFICHRRNASRW